MKPLYATVIFFFWCHLLAAQNITDTLKEVEVVEKNNVRHDKQQHYGNGQKVESISIAPLDQPLLKGMGEWLQQRLPVYVHSYGFNGTATLMLRGASAQQTQLLWKGVPLNNAAQGYADLSAIPLFLVSDVQLIYGSSAALWGSGNIGGALSIDNKPPKFGLLPSTLKANVGIGSFNHWAGGIHLGTHQKRWMMEAKGFVQGAENHFAYYNNSQYQRQTHAQTNSHGLMLNTAYLLTPNNKYRSTLEGALWWQKGQREIPAATFETPSQKQRIDEQLRSTLIWNRYGQRQNSFIQAAFLQEQFHYTDNAIALHSAYRTRTVWGEGGIKKWNLTPKTYLAQYFPVQWSWLHSIDTLVGSQQRMASVTAISTGDKHGITRWSAYARYEWFGDKSIFLPGGNGSIHLWKKKLLLGLSAQRTYRLPTLNELHYFPGGNKNLKPEQGWSADVDVQMGKYTVVGALQATHRTSLFVRTIKDWIIWYGGAVWTPHNMAQVRSSGVEWTHQGYWKWRKCNFLAQWNASWVSAIARKSYIPNDNSIGKQIPNTPRYTSLLSLEMTLRNIALRATSAYTGLRYLTTDQSFYIQGYHLVGLAASYQVAWRHYRCEASAQIGNLMNTRYEVVKGRPMPGRNFLCTLGFSTTR